MFELIGKAYALAIPEITPGSLGGGGNIKTYAAGLIDWIVWIAGALVVVYLIYGGIMYVTAGGDAEKATKGRTAVINAVIGLVIVLLALVIIKWVSTIINAGSSVS